MLKSYKYRIYPTDDQIVKLSNIFGQVRFVYNLGLETKINAWKTHKKSISAFDLNNQIKDLKDHIDWIDAPSQSLQMAMKNLDSAYNSFFKGGGFPKFKNKYSKQSFQLPQGVHFKEGKVFIPKLKLVDIDIHREFSGTIKTSTISKSVTNKYYISILVDTHIPKPEKKPIKLSTSVGVDLGIKDFLITSDGKKFKNQDFLKSELNRLRIEQRSLTRKVKGSNHYNNQKLKVALIHEHIRNKREDYLHKVSRYLVDNYDTICIEDLATSNMMKNHKLSRAIGDMGWYKFKSMLEYKCDWYGKNLKVIGRFEPSSKTCNSCGSKNHDLKLSDREWVCKECGEIHDRDINAALNIRNFGLRNQPSVTQRKSLDYACGVETQKSLAFA
jgi:putative transposase